MSTPGSGLARGLAITFRAMTRRAHTRQYPDHAPELPPRSRGVIALFEENCTVCMLCARECPDWCIYIDSHKETVQTEGAARARQRNVLDRFAIDFSLCMYCGICIEVCPFDALFWSPEFEYAEYDIRDMTHEKDRLREWMWTVPPPPALDPLAEPAKEVAAVEKARAKAEKPEGEEPAAAQKSAAGKPDADGTPAVKAVESAAKAAEAAAHAAEAAAKAAEGAAKAAEAVAPGTSEAPAKAARPAKGADSAGKKTAAEGKPDKAEDKPKGADASDEDDHSHPGSESAIRERRAGSGQTPSDGASA